MRILLLMLSFLIPLFCLSQETIVTVAIADSGKNEFNLQAKSQTPDYTTAYRILSNQIKLNPNDAELKYFLGYTIDRMNADDGRGMSQLKKEMTIKASEQFEEVNRLEPIYKGEKIILDPYAKLSSIWGSLAASYLNRNLIDSAKWAFSEGKKRGGFIEPILEFNRQLLNNCTKNSIFITIGDNITIPCWYLQTIENFRTDITIADASLIGTTWYPKYLMHQRNLKLSISDIQIDTMEYMEWTATEIKIVNQKDAKQVLRWELRPTYMDSYILKGDRIMLDMFRQNYFNRNMYFSGVSDSTMNLFLTNYLTVEGLVSRVSQNPNGFQELNQVTFNNLKTYTIQNINKEDILKSEDAIIVLNNIRWAYYSAIARLADEAKYERAKELILEMETKFSKEKLPYVSEQHESYFMQLFQLVNSKL